MGFAEELRRRRRLAGLTLDRLGGEAYSRSYLSRLESGIRAPTWPVVTHLAGRLGCRPEDLVPLAAWPAGWLTDRLAAAVAADDAPAVGRVVAAMTADPDPRVADVVERAWEYLVGREAAGAADAAGRLCLRARLAGRSWERALDTGILLAGRQFDAEDTAGAETTLSVLRASLPPGVTGARRSPWAALAARAELAHADLDGARRLAADALATATTAAHRCGALRLVAHAAFETGDVPAALAAAHDAVAAAEEADDLDLRADSLGLAAYLAERTGRGGRRYARRLAGLAARYRSAGRGNAAKAVALQASRGDPSPAAARRIAALSEDRDLDPLTRARARRLHADRLWGAGDRDAALVGYDAAIAGLVGCGRPRMAARTSAFLAGQLGAVGEHERATGYYRRSLELLGILPPSDGDPV